jgi:conjugative relaxase-like TrwC/TraI family protein
MSAHKLTAGHGYTYLTRHTMAHDGMAPAVDGIGAYYTERGESPGRWVGSGLTGMGIETGAPVSEQQMLALFGEGRHPDAAEIASELRADGHGADVIQEATELGTPFALNVAANEFHRQVAQLAAEWNVANRQPASADVPAWMMARIRTAVGGAMFAREHGRDAIDAQELSDFIARASKLGSKAVAGFDLTFSPVKSVSALWALASEPIAGQIEAAHHAAVADSIAWLERAATFTRLGRNGVRQVDTRGLVAAAFTHRASRAGDPDLHTHVAVSNKVQTLDGRWRALDGRVLFNAAVAASERYNTRLEAELRERVGVRFVARDLAAKRPIREIEGIDERLLAAWSRRRSAIDARRAELSAAFLAEHGRPPTPVEAIALAQQATLETRPAKPTATSRAQQRMDWRTEAAATLGEAGVDAMVATALTQHLSPMPLPDVYRLAELASSVITNIQDHRATWHCWNVIAEAQRVVRAANVPLAYLDTVVDHVVKTALTEQSIALTRPDEVTVEPPELRRADGTSVYVVAGSQLYTSAAVLDAERSVLAAAADFDGAVADTRTVELTILEAVANGAPLTDEQAEFVNRLATSGARLQLALAPAGTGKTTALQVLARAWTDDGGRVLALAPSAAAARLLGDITGTRSDTLAKALYDLDAGRLQLTDNTLVLVDEAGMASTPDLARLTAHVSAAGASVRFVGDDRQLAAIGAGGLLRDLAQRGEAVTLTTAVRFTDPAEAAAALRVREGAPDSLAFYLDNGRVQVGDEHTAALSAYEAWAADRRAGRDAMLLAATRDEVAALNARARADRLIAAGTPPGREVALADGTAASAGDAIITKHNDRRLTITATDWVKNGDRFTVDRVLASGALQATHRATGRHVWLPEDYVTANVILGYATTIHGAQGVTADTCHTVITGSESREQLYVAVTRGRHGNHLHVALTSADDEHAVIARDSFVPPTVTEVLSRVLAREEAARSATTEQRASGDPDRQLGLAVERYADAVAAAPVLAGQPPQRSAPLPWLAPVPRCADKTWSEYLRARAEQIDDLAAEVTDRMQARITPSAVLNLRDWFWQSHERLWRATHPEERPTELTSREQLYMRHLIARKAAIRQGWPPDPRHRWLPLVIAIDPEAVKSPDYPELAHSLSRAFDARLNIDLELPELLHGRDVRRAIKRVNAYTDERLELVAQAATPAPGFPSPVWAPTVQHNIDHTMSI